MYPGEVQQQDQRHHAETFPDCTANPLLADWVTKHVGDGWITELLASFHVWSACIGLQKLSRSSWTIKRRNKVRLAEYIREHNGIEVDPDSIFRCAGKASA